jgi:hypothetical protein
LRELDPPGQVQRGSGLGKFRLGVIHMLLRPRHEIFALGRVDLQALGLAEQSFGDRQQQHVSANLHETGAHALPGNVAGRQPFLGHLDRQVRLPTE